MVNLVRKVTREHGQTRTILVVPLCAGSPLRSYGNRRGSLMLEGTNELRSEVAAALQGQAKENIE